MAKAYGMPVNDGQTAPKSKESGTAEDGLSSLQKIGSMEHPITEQARFSAGERNENLPGGFKLVQ